MRNMHRIVGLVAAMAVTAGMNGLSLAADAEHPFRNAKVGDYLKHRATTELTGSRSVATVKHTVKAKTEKEVTLLEEVDIEGAQKKAPAKEIKIALDKPYAPLAATSEGHPVKVEELENGKETIKAGDKEYACSWIKCKTTLSKDGKDHVSIVKMWTSKEVALGGMVKTETQSEAGMADKFKTTLELLESHR